MLHEQLIAFKLILASNSIRRQNLMKDAGFIFEVKIPSDVSEDYPVGMNPALIPTFLAHKKSLSFDGLLKKNEIVITADTIVILDDSILGKPKNYDEAFEMLNALSGCKHEVITGVGFKSKEKEHLFSASSKVWFRDLTEQEIIYYIKEFKPYDKAGAYGIQEWIGYIGIERIEGSFFNVMGLPIQMLYVELGKFINDLS